MACYSSLHVDDRDMVGEDVVQLAGDAQPLVADPALGLLLARLLDLQRTGSLRRPGSRGNSAPRIRSP
jgi:hypothetical protein